MIFRRKKNQKSDEIDDTDLVDAVDPDELDDDTDDDEAETADDEVELDEETENEDVDDDAEGDDTTGDADEVEDDDTDLVDDSLRDDGPFDISEVDLDADEVDRLDFGTLVLTPFDGMQMQLQLDQSTGKVQSMLIMLEQSAMEIALFAAPARTSMVPEVVEGIIASTKEAGGETTVQEGPYGVELHRMLPVTDENGVPQGLHPSRTWFAQGPRWLLRAMLVGEAAQSDDFEGAGEVLLEVFRNIVVRRGDDPMVPGDLIPMTLPEGMAPPAEG